MKNLLILLFSIGLTLPMMAQKMSQGSMKMKITDISSKDMDEAQLNMIKSMMGSMTTNIYFKDDQAITKMNVMGSEITSIFDGKRTSVYTSMMGNKYVYHADITDEATEKSQEALKNANITKIKGKTQMIEGLKCQLYEYQAQGEDMAPMKFWTTHDIDVDPSLFSQMPKEARKIGFPMKMEIDDPNMGFRMVLEMKDISNKVDDSVFEFDTTGYKEMSAEELKRMGME